MRSIALTAMTRRLFAYYSECIIDFCGPNEWRRAKLIRQTTNLPIPLCFPQGPLVARLNC
jgi:hypothetical protein